MTHYHMRRRETEKLDKLVHEIISKKVAIDLAQYNRILNYFEVLNMFSILLNC